MSSLLNSSLIWLSPRVSVPFCRKAWNSYEAASFHSFTKAGIHNPVVEAWWDHRSDGVWNVSICTDRSMPVISTVLCFCRTQPFQLLYIITCPAWVVHWLYLYWWIWYLTRLRQGRWMCPNAMPISADYFSVHKSRSYLPKCVISLS